VRRYTLAVIVLVGAAAACNAGSARQDEHVEAQATALAADETARAAEATLNAVNTAEASDDDSENGESEPQPEKLLTPSPTFNARLTLYSGPENATFDNFHDNLISALTAGPRDYAELQTLMGGKLFLFTGPNIAEQEVAPADAANLLRTDYLPTTNNFSFSFGDEVNIPAYLGYQPLDEFPDAVFVLYTSGWLDGNGDGILIIEGNQSQGYRWAAVVIDADGFEEN